MVFLALPLTLLLSYLVLAFFGVPDIVAVILLIVATFAALPCLLLALRTPFRLWRIFAAAAGYGIFWWLIGAGSILADQSDRYGPLFLGHQVKENYAITIGGGLWLAGLALPFAAVMFVVLITTALLSRLLRHRKLARQEGPSQSV